MKKLRQGDVILVEIDSDPTEHRALSHLVLARGEATGHMHQISEGEAQLFRRGENLFLSVQSDTALLTHEEHHPVEIERGNYKVLIQREYNPVGWRYVAD